jgi:hypothetical protein
VALQSLADVVDDAQTAVRRERRRMSDEHQAFEQFAERVRRLDARTPREVGGQTVINRQSTGLRAVRDAYTETVMSAPHYREEYDETYAVSVASELGEELAAAVTTATRLHPQMKQQLIEASEQALHARERLVEILDEEAAALESTAAELADLRADVESLLDQPLDDAEFDALRTTRDRLRAVKDRCEELADERQATLRRQRRSLPVEFDDLGQYLYEGCDRTCPLLSALADLRRAVDRHLAKTTRRLAHCA